jgi:hypothetical protein
VAKQAKALLFLKKKKQKDFCSWCWRKDPFDGLDLGSRGERKLFWFPPGGLPPFFKKRTFLLFLFTP